MPGCDYAPPERDEPKPKPAEPVPEVKKQLLGPNVFFEVQGERRRVLISAEVCLRQGALELFLCRKDSKEHESIVHAEVDGRDIHRALIAARAEPGSPVRYVPKYAPAHGTSIRVGVEYEEKGKRVTKLAREWVKYVGKDKELDVDWVFAGSLLVDDPLDKNKKLYLANGGDMFCVSNFEDALLDLPINSSKDNAELSFEAYTDRIPPVGTKVVVTLEPILPAKKGK
jgi:hypothetical protein